jgi:transposase-like protein
MATFCRCQRCSRTVVRSTGSLLRKITFGALFLTTLPYAWTVFVLGPGLLGTLPIVVALALAINAAFADWAFPRPLCPHCGASLEHAPEASGASVDEATEATARGTRARPSAPLP